MKRWNVSTTFMKTRRSSRHAAQIFSDVELNECEAVSIVCAGSRGEELECKSLSANDNTRMDLNDPSIGDERQSFFEENDFTGMGWARGTEGTLLKAHIASSIFVEEFPGAANIIGKGHHLYSQNILTDEHCEKRKIAGPFYPFSGREDWETFKWLSSLNVPMEKLDEFFKLSQVYYFILPLSRESC